MTIRILHYSDLENVYDDPQRIGRLAGLIEQLRAEDTLVVGSGDNLAIGVLATVTEKGQRQALDFFDAIDPDADTLGNHDFDSGLDHTLNIVRDSPQIWVCANAHIDDQRFDAGDIVPTTVIEVADHRVGLFGIAHPETNSLASKPTGISFTDPIAAAKDAVTTLQEMNVDHIIALSHLGDDDELATAVDVDAILGGHRHKHRIEYISDVFVTRSAGNGDDLIELTIGDRASARTHSVTDAPIDEQVAQAYQQKIDAAGLTDAVATVDDPIQRTYETRFHHESRVGNFVSDAYRWATGADIGVVAGGSIRLGPPLCGLVTAGDIIGVVPFENRLAVARISGDDLLESFRNAEGGGPDNEPPWWHLHVSGASIVWDHTSKEVIEARINDHPLSTDEKYTLATSHYLFQNDSFVSLKEDNITDLLDVQYQYIVDYARERGIDPRVEGRIKRHNLP